MDLERGVLARIDRKLLAGLGQDEAYRMVRVPVTASKWSTWKRYCESAGVSMGRAIVALIGRELVSVFGDHAGDDLPVLAEQADEELTGRQEQVARREEVSGVEERLPGVERAPPQVGGRDRDPTTACRVRSEDIRSPGRGVDQGRSQRAMPVRIGSQVRHCHGRPGQLQQCCHREGRTASRSGTSVPPTSRSPCYVSPRSGRLPNDRAPPDPQRRRAGPRS